MLFDPSPSDRLGRLEAQLRSAHAVTPALLSEMISQACVRLASHSPGKAGINRLIEAGAFTDAALALVALELPRWNLRRLVYDDSEWICSLSRRRELPIELDEVAEATHEILPLAVLMAFLQALQVTTADYAGAAAVPSVRPASGYAVCCDNFS